jgi:formylglycine-generating enzyme required for sulfatase activity
MAEADPTTVSGFQLDKYDVTVGRFRAFVMAWKGGWKPRPGSGKQATLNGGRGLANRGSAGEDDAYEPGWLASNDGNIAPSDTNLASCLPYSTWTRSPAELENLPINCVNWYEGYAFCIWDGGFLPTEAEWEYAAAGGSQQREYPWGTTDPGTVNQYAIYDLDYCDPKAGAFCGGAGNIAPVGAAALGAGLWGQLDLAGELFQWSLDGYASYIDPCTDCADLASTVDRVIRGGNFFLGESYLLPTYRDYSTPANRSDDVGFRCARSAP